MRLCISAWAGRQRGTDQLAQAARKIVVLGGHDAAGLRRIQDSGPVQRLDGVHVYHTNLPAQLRFQTRGGLHGKMDHDTGTDKRAVAALAGDQRLADPLCLHALL